ncbi:DUF58 domain-containing protein [Phycicoccus sp. Soil803]|uniref:DUF58 domain-containing protein n=1 Tax=Phycicoccus sp. Soil803 TaxID=1736415 RepID=UPI00070FE549|nr:DUF58 domain-containing protein [Phycicoccus sp. Soil803]KRF23257.1 hypothetical protein ASG95_00595 [Phycicoccus sp. Soil803]
MTVDQEQDPSQLGEDVGHTTRRADLKKGRRRSRRAPGTSSTPLAAPPYAASPGARGGAAGAAGAGSTRPRRLPTLPTITVTRPKVPSAVTRAGRQATGVLARRTERLRGATRPVWGPVAAVLRWVSPLGWSILALGVLCWVVAAVADWAEWAMIGAGAMALVLCCALLAVGRTRVRIDTEVDPLRVTVGEPATGRIAVTNESRRGMLPLLVELPVGITAARFTLPPLGSGKVHEELFVVPTERRGVIAVGPASTVQGDPLGIVRRTLRWTDVTELFVHPRTTSLESLGAGLLRDLEGETTQEMSMSDLAFHALREYQPGDDRRYIHWRSSAKAGRLLVRQFLDTRRSHLTVVVDADPDKYAGGEEDAETAISVAASVGKRAHMDEQDFTIVCRDSSASRTSAPLAMDALARVELGPSDLYAMAGEGLSLAPDTSMAVLVTGSATPFIQVQRALGRFESEVLRVALTIDRDQRVGVKNVGGITLMNIHALGDLRAVLVGVMAT